MIRLKLFAIVVVALSLLACGTSPKVRQPFVVIRFLGISLVVENAASPGEALAIQEGRLRFLQHIESERDLKAIRIGEA